jgi:hypothetical protein
MEAVPRTVLVLILVAVAGRISVARGQEAHPASADPALSKFVQDYYKASTQRDVTKLRSLVYPQSLACIDAASTEYFRQELSLYPLNVITSAPTWQNWDSAAAKALAAKTNVKFPADPDSFIVIDWKETSGPVTTNHPSIVALKKVSGRYFQVLPCPSAADIQSRNSFFKRNEKKAP